MAIIRDLWTGKLVERPSSPTGREVIYREPVYYRPTRHGSAWEGEDRVSKSMSIPPEQATPERIAAENEAARHHGTGAYYQPDGTCRTPTNGSRNREMMRPRGEYETRYQDNDAGYGQYAGR